MKRTLVTRAQTTAERSPIGVRSAVLVGAWLALTLLFMFGGVVLLGAVSTALGRAPTIVAALIPTVGIFGVYGVSPTLARVVVVAAVERLEANVGADIDPEPDGWRSSSSETDERVCCQTPCCS